MNKLYFLVGISHLILQGCGFVEVHRHINTNLDNTQPFEVSGQWDKKFAFSTGKMINALEENVNAKSDAKIEKLEIETLQLSIALAPNNTATSLHNVHIKLGSGWSEPGETLAKFDTTRVPVNEGVIFAANSLMILKGVSAVKKSLNEVLITKRQSLFELNMSAFVPAGQTFRGSIKLILKASFDAVTCEAVPIGFGPSECMIVPITLNF